jgi:hypothetical protein
MDYAFARGGDRDEIEITFLHEMVHAFYESAYPDDDRLDAEQEEDVAEKVAGLIWRRSLDPERVRAVLERLVDVD